MARFIGAVLMLGMPILMLITAVESVQRKGKPDGLSPRAVWALEVCRTEPTSLECLRS